MPVRSGLIMDGSGEVEGILLSPVTTRSHEEGMHIPLERGEMAPVETTTFEAVGDDPLNLCWHRSFNEKY